MVSRISNDQQSLEDLYFEKFGFPMIFCNSHQQSIIDSINLNHSNTNKLVCTKCIIKDRLNSQFLISVGDIFSKNPSNIIQNWPPLPDFSIYEQLMANYVQESKKNQSIEQIKQYFSILKEDILKIIDEHQKNILVHINIIEENRQSIVDVYNKICQKDEMKNQFQQNKTNQKELEEYLKKLISSKQTQSNQNQQHINNSIDIFTKSQSQFQFDYIENLFKQLLTDLKQIDLLNPLLTIDKQFQSRVKGEKTKQDDDNKQREKIDKIMKLINNKSNFCNQNFLNNMKDILMMNKQIFTQIDLDNCFYEECEPFQFEHFKKNELQQLAYVISGLHNQEINTNSNDQIQQFNQENKIFEQSILIIQYLLKHNENRIIEEMKQNNTQNTQMIQNQINQLQREINQKDSLLSLKIIKSKYSKPEYVSFKKTDYNYFEIERDSNQGEWSQVIIDLELIPENKYQIQIELKSLNNNDNIMLGLIPISQKDSHGWLSKLSLFTQCSSQHGIDKIECGKHISSIKGDVKQITFQICLKEEILRCQAIVKNQKNISSLDSFTKIKSNENYYFYIGLYQPNSKVEIQQFKIVKQFEHW